MASIGAYSYKISEDGQELTAVIEYKVGVKVRRTWDIPSLGFSDPAEVDGILINFAIRFYMNCVDPLFTGIIPWGEKATLDKKEWKE